MKLGQTPLQHMKSARHAARRLQQYADMTARYAERNLCDTAFQSLEMAISVYPVLATHLNKTGKGLVPKKSEAARSFRRARKVFLDRCVIVPRN